ncbi:MAG: hypothetical protein ACOVMP_04960 [Chthoniobacterales bacterium]
MELPERIIEHYSHHLREHGHPPQSVFRFCKDLEITESEFFRTFGSLEAVESALWQKMIERVIESVSNGAEWESFGSRQRTLAFLFAFLESSLELRSLLLVRKEVFRPFCRSHAIAGFAAAHKRFMTDVIDKGRETGEVAERGVLTGFYPEVFLTHLLAVIEFHLADTSAGFERTDAFVEKTVNLAFDVIRTQAVDSAFDLVRFLIPRH